MKHIVCEQPNQFSMKEVDKPVIKEGEVLVKVKRIGICGTDLHAYQGNQPFFSYPRVLGHELAGEVAETGKGVTGWTKGDAVTIIPYMECGKCIACRTGKPNCCTNMSVLGVHKDGGMSEYIAVPVSHVINTNGLSFDQTALIEPLSIGAHAIRRSGLQGTENVLVIGAGPIGLGIMALAKQTGARVIAMDINKERLQFSQNWAGADEIVNPLETPAELLAEMTDGDFPTVVFDATGNQKSMNKSFDFVSHGGTLVFVGLMKKDVQFHDPDFHKKELTLMSSRNATKEDFESVISHLRSGKVSIEGYLSHRCDFDEMVDQFDNWLLPESNVIKAVVEL